MIDTFGIELIHLIREGRSPKQIGKKGISNHRWIVGGKLCLAVNHLGSIVGWSWLTANAHDSSFHPVVELFEADSVIFSDTGFHSASGDPENLKCSKRGQWSDRMLIETVFSMLTTVCHFKKVLHWVEEYFQAGLGFTIAAFNLLIYWKDWQPDEQGFVPISIAKFSL